MNKCKKFMEFKKYKDIYRERAYKDIYNIVQNIIEVTRLLNMVTIDYSFILIEQPSLLRFDYYQVQMNKLGVIIKDNYDMDTNMSNYFKFCIIRIYDLCNDDFHLELIYGDDKILVYKSLLAFKELNFG